MAGFYDDAPSRRMAWDVDGTIATVFLQNGTGTSLEIIESNRIIMNNEDEVFYRYKQNDLYSRYLTLIFPELRDIDGTFFAYEGRFSPQEVDSTADTTNGIDGNWIQQISNIADYTIVAVNFRNNISGLSAVSHKAIRVRTSWNDTNKEDQNVRAWHIYGTIAAGETPDRILFLDTENSDAVFTKPLDFAEVPRGQTSTRTFKIKNNSASLTINTVNVTAEDLYLNAGDWYEFGPDGIAWSSTYAVGNIANGAEELIHMKQEIPDNETLGIQTARIEVSHDSLS